MSKLVYRSLIAYKVSTSDPYKWQELHLHLYRQFKEIIYLILIAAIDKLIKSKTHPKIFNYIFKNYYNFFASLEPKRNHGVKSAAIIHQEDGLYL